MTPFVSEATKTDWGGRVEKCGKIVTPVVVAVFFAAYWTYGLAYYLRANEPM